MRRGPVLALLASALVALAALPAGAWAADTTPPDLAFTGSLYSKPITNAATPQAEFTVSDASGLSSVQCKVDGGAYADCTSPYPMPGLGDGLHTVTVRAIDASPLQNSNTQSFQFIIDTTPPTLDLPASGTAKDIVTWGFADDNGPVTSHCQLDSTPAVDQPCSTPLDVSTVAPGTYTFTVTVTDAAGNFTTGHEALTISHTAPTVTITSGPTGSNVTNDPTPSFGFSTTGTVTSTRCAIFPDLPADCSSPFTPSASLADGPHIFEVDVSDGAQTASNFASFVVDTKPPTITFAVPDGSYVNGAVGFSVFDASSPSIALACDIGDGAGFQPCTTTISLASLGDGPHTIAVRATDAATNASYKSLAIVIDRTPPDITPGSITVGPGTATVTFSASDAVSPVTVQCRLDGGPYGACTTAGSDTVTGVAPGAHSIDVLVVDAAGNRNIFTAGFTIPAPSSGGTTGAGSGGGSGGGTTAADTTPPKLTATLLRRAHRAPALRLRCDEPCTITLTFTRKGRTLLRRTLRLAANRTVTVTLKLPRKAFGRARSLKVSLRVRAVDRSGNARTRTLSLTLRR